MCQAVQTAEELRKFRASFPPYWGCHARTQASEVTVPNNTFFSEQLTQQVKQARLLE